MQDLALNDKFNTTSDRIGTIMRTKAELYYFLAVECIITIFEFIHSLCLNQFVLFLLGIVSMIITLDE